MSDKLELRWPGKGHHVLQSPETGKWEFCGNSPLPFCPLIELETFGTEKKKPFADENSNLLIKGENLFALQALQRTHAGKVKLIYIDPPFNTGNEFLPYDDNFQHSVWLSLMKSRLEMLKSLLSEQNGIIFIHMDDTEQPYVRVVMDEIFGRKRGKDFLSQIVWERSAAAGIGQGASYAVNTTEYILVYAKNFQSDKLPLFRVGGNIETKTMRQYNKILLDAGKRQLIYEFNAKSNGEPVSIYTHTGFDVRKIPFRNFDQQEANIRTLYNENFHRIFRTTNPQKENTFQQELISKMEDGLYSVDYIPSRGKFQAKPTTLYYFNKELFCWLSETAELKDHGVVKFTNMTDLWRREEIPATGIASEGAVELKRSKKPEALLKRIIESATQQGDVVLDCFAGSGTTLAVAHKLQRRWIGVELGDQSDTLCLPRLQRVISGADLTGISKQVGWKGGGGFRYLEVGAPLLVQDPETCLTILNPHYKNSKLVRAVCQMEGFALTGDGKHFHGRNGTHAAHVTEDFVDDAYVRRLAARLPEGYALTIYGLKFQRSIHRPRNVALRRMQTSLVKPYLTKGA